jgi:oligopeptide transport system substrate-binding protein
MLAILAGGCTGRAQVESLPVAQPVEFVMNNGSIPRSLDPAQASSAAEQRICLALFEGLVINDPETARARPGLAEAWTVDQDGRRITFTLRPATWTDGTMITAMQVRDSWLRTLAPGTAAGQVHLLTMLVKGAREYHSGEGGREVVGIRALDAGTFQVDLVAAMPQALDMMTHPAFAVVPTHAIAAKGANWLHPGNIVTNGPFRLASWQEGEPIILVRNTAYWDATNVALDGIRFLAIDDAVTAYKLYLDGAIDWCHGLAPDRIDGIGLRPDYHLTPRLGSYFYIFNMTRRTFADVRVRKALAMALDVRELAESLLAGRQLATTGLVPAMDGYAPLDGQSFDAAGARAMLAEAGFPAGRGFPAISILFNSHDEHSRIAEWVSASWQRNLGIKVSLRSQVWPSFLDMRSTSRNFDIARSGWVSDYLDPGSFLDIFMARSELNDGRYANPAYDALLRKAVAMPAGPARLATLRQAEQLLVETDQAIIPLFHYAGYDLIDTSIWGGWQANPLGAHNWKFIYRK